MSQRREINHSSESTYSIASSIADSAQTAFQYLRAVDLENIADEAILSQTLSTRTIISTTSSFATRHQRAAASHSAQNQQFVQIGEGLQGAIFEQVGKALIIKKESPQVSPSRLAKEYDAHEKISLAFQKFDPLTSSTIRVPRPGFLKGPDDHAFWNENFSKFPIEYQSKTMVFKMDRILPLPKIVRKALISFFYPRHSVDRDTARRLLSEQSNKHCLARIYLGKKDWHFTEDRFSLRNFPLCLDAMRQLGLQVDEMAYSMGKAYATIQWGAEFNADDVEFVLGTVAKEDSTSTNFQKRAVQLCLLDFGQCDSVNMEREPEEVYMAFQGALVLGDNQWFIPHCHRDPELFKWFRAGYIEAGNIILSEKEWHAKFNMEDFMKGYEEYAEDFLI